MATLGALFQAVEALVSWTEELVFVRDSNAGMVVYGEGHFYLAVVEHYYIDPVHQQPYLVWGDVAAGDSDYDYYGYYGFGDESEDEDVDVDVDAGAGVDVGDEIDSVVDHHLMKRSRI